MSAKAMREASGKAMLGRALAKSGTSMSARFAVFTTDSNWAEIVVAHPWLLTEVQFHSRTSATFRNSLIFIRDTYNRLTWYIIRVSLHSMTHRYIYFNDSLRRCSVVSLT